MVSTNEMTKEQFASQLYDFVTDYLKSKSLDKKDKPYAAVHKEDVDFVIFTLEMLKKFILTNRRLATPEEMEAFKKEMDNNHDD